jgi:hypothetical protein
MFLTMIRQQHGRLIRPVCNTQSMSSIPGCYPAVQNGQMIIHSRVNAVRDQVWFSAYDIDNV